MSSREELGDYMVDRLTQEWFQEVMVNCQEIDSSDLAALRSLGLAVAIDRAAAGPVEGGVLQPTEGPVSGAEPVSEELLQAIRWSTGVREDSVLLVVAEELAPAERLDQLQRYRGRGAATAARPAAKALVIPTRLQSRQEVACRYHEFLQSRYGWEKGMRRPRDASLPFLRAWDWGPWSRRGSAELLKNVRRWHEQFLQSGDAGAGALAPTGARGTRRGRRPAGAEHLAIFNRRRRRGGGRSVDCAWLRQELFEWWSGMRHSVDWQAIRRGCPSHGHEPKKLARFTQAMLTQKANELIASYCTKSLKAGCQGRVPQLSSAWWRKWRREYGLSMKYPNRRFKVGLSVLKARLARGWLNVYRVRAACLALLKYDPEMENFDESPFHHNETGSQNTRTLTVAGRSVPLHEAHADTRLRWSANFMTWSDPERVEREGPPPVECMFRAMGGGAHQRPKYEQHILGRGHGSWMSASASRSGSYKVGDVLDFLKRHLPERGTGPQQRAWRILLADDAAAHRDHRVARLAWSRGYVYIVHGGGVTPIVQVVDTHFNQHAKRKYMQKEGAALLRQMQLGKVVPALRAVDCIDLMAEVCKDKRMHLMAARGFIETGLKVNLDDALLDEQITKEARFFWDSLGMREQVNQAVRDVREEVAAGRLRWTFQDISGLVLGHPHAPDDDVLARVGDHFDEGDDDVQARAEAIRDGEPGGEDASSEAGSDHAAEGGLEEGSDAEEHLGGWSSPPAPADDGGCASSAAAGAAAIALRAGITEAEARQAEECTEVMHMFDMVAASLREYGEIAAAGMIEGCRDKERRRRRLLCREDPGVLDALTQLHDAQRTAEQAHKQRHQEAKRQEAELRRLNREVAKQKQLVRAEKRKLADAQACAHERSLMQRVGLPDLGYGKRSCGGEKCKNARVKVLERVSMLGRGLSTEQRLNFGWFCEEWDSHNLTEYGAEWPATFATWVQRVIERLERGESTAVSHFVKAEWERCLSDRPALALPPVPSAAAAAAAAGRGAGAGAAPRGAQAI